ncbi:MAG: hypothetical protein ACYC4S_00555 [Rhodoferax sp.]
MKKVGRQAVDEAIVAEESRLLSAIWYGTPAKDRGSQAVFGEKLEIGNQSAVGQFLRGESPLSLKAAKGFAKGLGCRIAEFSPRLAELETAWPFELVDRERYEALSPAMRHKAQVRMMDAIAEIEAQHQKANRKAA